MSVDAQLWIATAKTCPHPDDLERQSIIVQGRFSRVRLCGRCFRLLRELREQWLAGVVKPADVVARIRAAGYTRRDGAQFLLQLAAARLRVRLGFAHD